ncbi:MAG: YkgJ family cysteine cluster protein [Pirellulaceae bacterium]
MPTADFLCIRCARHMKTCCQTTEIFVTRGDVARIAEHSGQGDFFEFRRPVNPDYADQDDDPAWRDNVFQADGSRRVLKKQAAGDCTFLGSAGCTLPLETRPLICRIYPYDYDAAGIQHDLAPGCPLELLRPGLTLIDELAMNRADAERWHQQLYAELCTENIAGDSRAIDDRPAEEAAVGRGGVTHV